MNVIKLFKNNSIYEAVNQDAIYLSEKFGFRLFQNKTTIIVRIADVNIDLIEFVLNKQNVKIQFYECPYQESNNIIDYFNSDDKVLQSFFDNVDYYTGEIISGLSNDLKNYINNIDEKMRYYSKIFQSKNKWIDEDINILKEKYNSGVSLKEIARSFSVRHTRKEIKSKVLELRLIRNKPVDQENKGSRWTEEEDKTLHDEFIAGKTIAEISKIHQRSNGGIRARLKKQGLIDEYGRKTF